MANWLLFTDPHFTDNELESYRWLLFEKLLSASHEHNITHIVCLGDVVDRKDKHSATLVNRLIDEFSYLQIHSQASIFILSGNHDKPISGPYYWQFLDRLRILYIIKPASFGDIWLLPYSANPLEEWKTINFSNAKAVMMHQTGAGVTVEAGFSPHAHNLPIFPRGVKVFSGDVHRPQEANGIVYIGVPHPVRFSETWDNRMIVVKDDYFAAFLSVPLAYTKRAILDIKDASELEKLDFSQGDQVRIRYMLQGSNLSGWPAEQERIKEWALKRGVLIASIGAEITGDTLRPDTEQARELELMKPEDVIRQFAVGEKLSDDVVQMGIDLLRLV